MKINKLSYPSIIDLSSNGSFRILTPKSTILPPLPNKRRQKVQKGTFSYPTIIDIPK